VLGLILEKIHFLAGLFAGEFQMFSPGRLSAPLVALLQILV
jgi:hypothetical protein